MRLPSNSSLPLSTDGIIIYCVLLCFMDTLHRFCAGHIEALDYVKRKFYAIVYYIYIYIMWNNNNNFVLDTLAALDTFFGRYLFIDIFVITSQYNYMHRVNPNNIFEIQNTIHKMFNGHQRSQMANRAAPQRRFSLTKQNDILLCRWAVEQKNKKIVSVHEQNEYGIISTYRRCWFKNLFDKRWNRWWKFHILKLKLNPTGFVIGIGPLKILYFFFRMRW